MSVRTKERGKSWFYNFGIRLCTAKDFTDKGAKMSKKFEKKIV